jgi:hypothetical protein
MIGNRIGTDPAELGSEVSPIVKARHLIEQITYELSALEKMTDWRSQQMADLEKAGVYEAEPTPSFEERNGTGRYLRLVYPTNGGSRRREYIGCDPDKIAAALAQVERTRQDRLTRNRLVQLTNEVRHVARALSEVNDDLARLVRTLGQT